MKEENKIMLDNGMYVIIKQDDDCDYSPREDINLGIMICFHKRYNLGDKTELKESNFSGWEELEIYIKKELKGICIIPLYLLDHSGITISCYPADDLVRVRGKIGFIYTTQEKINEMGVKRNYKKIKEYLINEVKYYDEYLRGNIFCYTIYKDNKCDKCNNVEHEIIDSCFGFIGDIKDSGIIEHIEHSGKIVDKNNIQVSY